eukprot:scaffold22234_cov73-Skeletonema_marinoi.AAC.3
MLTDEEIAAAAEVEANAADAADVFEDFDNMPDTADQPPSRNLTSAERARALSAALHLMFLAISQSRLSVAATTNAIETGTFQRQKKRWKVESLTLSQRIPSWHLLSRVTRMTSPMKVNSPLVAGTITGKVDTNPTAIDTAILLDEEGAAGDSRADGKPKIQYVEDKFDYKSEDNAEEVSESEDDDSDYSDPEDDDEEVPTSEPNTKPPASKLDLSSFPPKDLSISSDIEALISEMNNSCNLCAPDVEEKHLSHHEGVDQSELNKMLGRRGAVASARAQGFTLHDTTELKIMGFQEEVALRIQYCMDDIQALGGEKFRVSVDYDKKTFGGLFCNSCNSELHRVESCRPESILKKMTSHMAGCNKICSFCELNAAAMHDSYKQDKYLEYQAQLCKGETAVPFDEFVDKALAYGSELQDTGQKFFKEKSTLFNNHDKRNAKGHTCQAWYENYEKLQKYVHEHKSTRFESKKLAALFSIDLKEAHKLGQRLSTFRKKYFDENEDGSYGDKSLDNNYTGVRYDQIHSLHVYLGEERTKGMKKLTILGFTRSKK